MKHINEYNDETQLDGETLSTETERNDGTPTWGNEIKEEEATPEAEEVEKPEAEEPEAEEVEKPEAEEVEKPEAEEVEKPEAEEPKAEETAVEQDTPQNNVRRVLSYTDYFKTEEA
jgi:hypothetical protein